MLVGGLDALQAAELPQPVRGDPVAGRQGAVRQHDLPHHPHLGAGIHRDLGVDLLRDDRAVGYRRGRNAEASPYRFRLEVEPEVWFLEDEGYELAVFHSHLSSPPRPSRTDVENIGLWQGKPYLILSLGSDSLAGWTIVDGRIEPLALVA